MFILTVMEDMVKINPDQFDREFSDVSMDCVVLKVYLSYEHDNE
mgnify:CR=1 FL=1